MQVYKNIQEKIVKTSKQLSTVEAQLSSNTREAKKAELTNAEIAALPKDTTTYVSVGKMFVLKPKEAICTDLAKQATLMYSIADALGKKKVYLQKELKDAQDNMRDFIHHSKRT
ncbi:hypothetical protein BB560_001247 [Smittium megazygosporum]|uniref:Prefoldin subunit 1 n=1 Tax=Smittium megazygosporum TaxID=133381 RepID=A0A2T9ZI21_9FUNG|nr:hypothetical protein BB560_001247 [Smittium megazygosporum]